MADHTELEFAVQQLLADADFPEHGGASGGVKAGSARLIGGERFEASAQGELVESARVDDGVAADRTAIGKKAAQDGEVISKEKGMTVRVVYVFGLYEKGTASLEVGFRLRKG